jgi:predicted CoA-binding protein
MVDVFRKKEFVYDITKEAIKINAKVLWTQLGIFCEDSFSLAKDAGLNVVMNKCPIIELVD